MSRPNKARLAAALGVLSGRLTGRVDPPDSLSGIVESGVWDFEFLKEIGAITSEMSASDEFVGKLRTDHLTPEWLNWHAENVVLDAIMGAYEPEDDGR